MKTQQSGFTLIELIAVIVILGILAAVAVPKFVDLSDTAQQASAKASAGALGSAAALNHAGATAIDAGLSAPTPRPISIASCGDVENLLETGLSEDFEVAQEGSENGVLTCGVYFADAGEDDESLATFTAWTWTDPDDE